MPNWCEGVLRIKGKWENLIKFLTEGLEPIGGSGSPDDIFINEQGDDYLSISIKNAHIKYTRRGFIEPVYTDIIRRKESDYDVVCLDAKFAWTVRAEQLADISKTFHVDFRIYAFEQGGQFNRDIEVIDGNITKDREVFFDDYEWDCINPLLGG